MAKLFLYVNVAAQKTQRKMKKKILVTGGAGFIGTNFILNTLKKKIDWEIVNFDALTYSGNPSNFSNLPHDLDRRYEFTLGNICEAACLWKVFETHSFDGDPM